MKEKWIFADFAMPTPSMLDAIVRAGFTDASAYARFASFGAILDFRS